MNLKVFIPEEVLPVTMPSERKRAINQTREFLGSLLDRKATPRVPEDIRDVANRLLRHYPHAFEVEVMAEACPKMLDPESNT